MNRKKCTIISYNCGSTCLPLQKNCRIGSAAIGRERLNKVKEFASLVAGGGKDPRKGIARLGPEGLESLAQGLQQQRNTKAQSIRDHRLMESLSKTAGESKQLGYSEFMDLGRQIAESFVKKAEASRGVLNAIDSEVANRRSIMAELRIMRITSPEDVTLWGQLQKKVEESSEKIESFKQKLEQVGQEFIDQLRSTSELERGTALDLARSIKKSRGWKKTYPNLDEKMADYFQLTHGAGYPSIKNVSVRKSRGKAFRDGIHINPKDDLCLYHEMSHHIEFASPEVLKASKEFLESKRTGGAKSLRKMTGNPSYKTDEFAVPDHFIDPYVGKIYSNGLATEVLSMGLEALSKGRHVSELALRDPEHLYFVLGVVRGRKF